MRRRTFLAAVSAVPLTWALAKQALAAGSQITASKVAEIQQNWQALLAKDAAVTLSTAPLQKTEAEWKQLLSDQQFNVLRREGTEHPFASPLNGEKRAGVFVCAGCNLPLFSSQMQYDSGTGWPSFFTSIPGHLDTKKDLHLILKDRGALFTLLALPVVFIAILGVSTGRLCGRTLGGRFSGGGGAPGPLFPAGLRARPKLAGP